MPGRPIEGSSSTVFTALDIFCGAGGLSIGLTAAGVEVVGGVEKDADAAATWAESHPGASIILGDISTVDWAQWDGVDLVVGGPPCQPWSTGGLRLGEADERDGWPAFVSAIERLRPRAFIAENVAGLAEGAMRPRWLRLTEELASLRYSVSAKVLNAADYGVPQKRRRCMVVGLRDDDTSFVFPAPTHGPGGSSPWRTAGSVIGVEAVGTPNTSIVTYASNPDLRRDPYGGHVYNGGGRPINLDAPAPTLLASMGGNRTPWVDVDGIVPEYHAHLVNGGSPRSGRVPGARRITVVEAALLQTFEASTAFTGSRSSQYRQIGNAVPPLLAAKVGGALLDRLRSGPLEARSLEAAARPR